MTAILVPALTKQRETRHRRACAENLKQLGLALYLYAVENSPVNAQGYHLMVHPADDYPPVDDSKNNFMLDANFLFPEYLSDPMLGACPAYPRRDPETGFRRISDHSKDGVLKGEERSDCFTDDSYVYLGWTVVTDKETEALLEAYDKLSPNSYDTDIIVPEGWGNAEGDTIHRLSGTADRFLITELDIINGFAVGSPSVPVIWDRPYAETAQFSHRPAGGNVLYLDGHVDFIKFGTRFPINETMARLLDERPRERIPDCDE
jgi:prepilin-type processing-associated H-X9-DG protein